MSGKLKPRMKQYRCHKTVHAALITSIHVYPLGDAVLHFAADTTIFVGADWMSWQEPKAGGYYVKHPDGYAEFLPAEAFEAGYTEITS